MLPAATATAARKRRAAATARLGGVAGAEGEAREEDEDGSFEDGEAGADDARVDFDVRPGVGEGLVVWNASARFVGMESLGGEMLTCGILRSGCGADFYDPDDGCDDHAARVVSSLSSAVLMLKYRLDVPPFTAKSTSHHTEPN
jgi:hypothetical protein